MSMKISESFSEVCFFVDQQALLDMLVHSAEKIVRPKLSRLIDIILHRRVLCVCILEE